MKLWRFSIRSNRVDEHDVVVPSRRSAQGFGFIRPKALVEDLVSARSTLSASGHPFRARGAPGGAQFRAKGGGV